MQTIAGTGMIIHVLYMYLFCDNIFVITIVLTSTMKSLETFRYTLSSCTCGPTNTTCMGMTPTVHSIQIHIKTSLTKAHQPKTHAIARINNYKGSLFINQEKNTSEKNSAGITYL